MGKQSSRIYIQGKDHKDVYFQGKFHRAIYLGSKLLWEKLPGEKFFLYRHSYKEGDVNYSNPKSFDVDSHLITDYRDYIQDNEDYSVFGNNLYTRVGTFLFTHDGKTFFEHNIETDRLDSISYVVADGYILRKAHEDNASVSTYYFVETDKNVNEISKTELFDTDTYFITRVPIPRYPYFYEYLIFSRSYNDGTYYSECVIIGKHGGYRLEYTCSGRILFCYCEERMNMVFTDSGNLHMFENGSIKYRISVPSNIYACLKMKDQRRYILYARPSGTAPFAMYQTTDFADIERINKDYLEITNPTNPSMPFVLIMNGNNQNEILSNYERCYHHLLDARNDIRTQLSQSTMFEDGERKNFDSFRLLLSFSAHGGGVATDRYVYIDNLLFEESEKNYIP